MPLIPLVFLTGLTGASGFIAGGALSDKFGTALTVAGFVVGLFLIFMLAQRFNLGVSF